MQSLYRQFSPRISIIIFKISTYLFLPFSSTTSPSQNSFTYNQYYFYYLTNNPVNNRSRRERRNRGILALGFGLSLISAPCLTQTPTKLADSGFSFSQTSCIKLFFKFNLEFIINSYRKGKQTGFLSLKNKAPNHPIHLLVFVYTDFKQNITFFIHSEQYFSHENGC